MISSRSAFAATALACLATLAHAASLDVFRVNLDPLIDKAAHRRTQFAVDVPRRLNSESSGTWTIAGDNATWEYSIRIPTAVSMAFHATRLTLPAPGILTLTGGGQSFTYRGHDLHRAEFWSRPLKGDEIAMRITVPRVLRHQALMQIEAFQAGYKSLSADVADHPHYRAIKAAVSAAAAGCVENYVCDATAQTQNQANASVAIVIGNKFACSGTLLNDVPQDGAPYVLTARHCENGEDGGGDPGAASSVEVFWNSVTPCGQALMSIFDTYSQTQYGAITVVEQQDEWLIKLDSAPPVATAYFAGWDAGGGALVGGYTIDYAGANTQQYVTWAGTAATVDYSASALQVGYASTYWGVVNSKGSIDHGASGSGIFNANGLLVGSSSLAVVGQCPANPPPVPSKDTQVALFNRFASTWNSTADATSSTHVTLQAVLDPATTGATSVSGIAGIPPSAYLFTSLTEAQTGTSILLQFNTTIGAVCTATGGVAGDGWSGVLNAYPGDSISIVENNPGVVTYGMKCVSGNRSSSAQVTVTWSLAPPTLTFYAQSFGPQFVGVSDLFVWQSNQASCVAGGGTPGDGWGGSLSGSGQVQVTETQPGSYSYTLNCGTGSQAISQTLTLTWGLPTVSMHLYTDPGLRIGQNIWIQWQGSGDCTASGGAPGDGWAGPLSGAFGNQFVTEQSAGTYTFTVSCGPAAVAATAQVTYNFSGAAASAALTAAQTSYLIDLSVQTIPNLLTWTSNVQPCELDYAGPENGLLVSGYPADGTDDEPRRIAGTYTYTLTCGTGAAQATATTTINWTQQPNPKVTLSAVDGNEFPLTGGFLHYSTNVLPCTGSGGTPGDGWNGNLPFYGGPSDVSGGEVIEPVAGIYTFTITCGIGNTASAQATVVYNNLGGSVLTLTPGSEYEYITLYAGQPVLLAWTSAIGPCTGYGGTSGDGWSGPHPQQGSLGVIEPLGFEGPLSLVCGTGSAAVEAQSLIWIYEAASAVRANLSASPSSNEVGHTVSLQWSGDEAASCTATGGVAGDGWTGTLPYYGSMTVVESQPGTVSYGLSCQNGSLSDHTTMSIQWDPAPTITLSSSTQSAFWNTPFTLTWSSGNGAYDCNATEDDGAGLTFSGNYGDSGSMTLQESSGAQHSYTMSCQSNYGVVQARTIVNFSASTSGSGSGGSGSGNGSSSGGSSKGSSGGGDLDAEMIALLALIAALRAGAVKVRLRRARPQG